MWEVREEEEEEDDDEPSEELDERPPIEDEMEYEIV